MKKFYGKNLSISGEEHNRSRRRWLPKAGLAFFMLCGIIFAFRDIMAGDICLVSAIAVGTLVILACMGTDGNSKIARIVRLVIYGMSVAGFLLFILFAIRGFLDAANRTITLWNLRFNTDARLFETGGDLFSSTVFWTLAAVPLSVFLVSRIQRRKTGLLIIFLSVALLFAFVLGQSAGWGTVLLLALGIFGAFLYVAAPGRILQPGGALCIFLVGAVMFGLTFIFSGYNGMDALSRFKMEVHDCVEKIRYGEDSLPKGNLNRAQELLSSNKETLKLSIERPQELYLRGFVGSVYQKDRWTPLVWADYQGEYEGILEWLKSQNFIPVAQYAKYDYLNGQYVNGQADAVQAEVRNVGAYRKYVYLPVSVSSWKGAGAKAEKDAQFLSGKLFGAKKYTFDMINQVPTAEKFLTPQWIEEPETSEQEKYCDAEAVYHSFVKDTYMEVNDEIKSLIQEEFFTETEETEDFAEITRQIRRVLRTKAVYTGNPLKLPKGKDMITWFLKESETGNAVHFATTAVMAYRTAGYPARYVEGYHLTEDQAEYMDSEGLETITLTGQDSHAWVEVYIFGAGWLPVEVTPGMYTESYSEQIVEGKPAYQIGTHKEDEGLNLEEGENNAGGGKEEEPKKSEHIFRYIPAVLLLLCYMLFLLFLFLEAQRAARIFLRKKKAGNHAGKTDGEADRLEHLLRIAGVKGKYDHPFEMGEQVESCLPGIQKADYYRAVEIIQKEEFGGYALREGEQYTLRRFDERMRESLCRKKGLIFKMLLRYWYAVERGE